MKIFFFTEGGKDIGFGHITRCISIYQAFKEKRIEAKLVINADRSVIKIIKGCNYQILDWLKERKITSHFLNRADVVVIDSYLADVSFYKIVAESVRCPVYIDDCQRIHYPRGMLINGSVYADQLRYRRTKDSIYLLGAEYAPVRGVFWNMPRKKIGKDIRSVLVTCGGLEYNNLLYNLVNYLKESFNYVFGLVGKEIVDAKKMLGLMQNTDACISGGGQTTYELARCGVPTIGVCFADNQLLNLLGWQEKEFLRYVGWYNDKKIFVKIASNLEDLDYKNRAIMKSVGQSLVDGQGARRIVREILRWARA